MLNFTSVFYNSAYFPFYKGTLLTRNSDSCKTTISNMFHEELGLFLMKITAIGGALSQTLLNLWYELKEHL